MRTRGCRGDMAYIHWSFISGSFYRNMTGFLPLTERRDGIRDGKESMKREPDTFWISLMPVIRQNRSSVPAMSWIQLIRWMRLAAPISVTENLSGIWWGIWFISRPNTVSPGWMGMWQCLEGRNMFSMIWKKKKSLEKQKNPRYPRYPAWLTFHRSGTVLIIIWLTIPAVSYFIVSRVLFWMRIPWQKGTERIPQRRSG